MKQINCDIMSLNCDLERKMRTDTGEVKCRMENGAVTIKENAKTKNTQKKIEDWMKRIKRELSKFLNERKQRYLNGRQENVEDDRREFNIEWRKMR